MTTPAIKPETSEYRALLDTLSAPSNIAPILTAADCETAELVARETGRSLYRIDLSMIISKYIGESEKGLDKLDEELSAGVALIVEMGETVTSPVDADPVLHKLSERAGLIIFVIDEPNRLPDRLQTLLKAHIQAAGDG